MIKSHPIYSRPLQYGLEIWVSDYPYSFAALYYYYVFAAKAYYAQMASGGQPQKSLFAVKEAIYNRIHLVASIYYTTLLKHRYIFSGHNILSLPFEKNNVCFHRSIIGREKRAGVLIHGSIQMKA